MNNQPFEIVDGKICKNINGVKIEIVEPNIAKKKFTASFDVDAQNTFTPKCPEELPIPDGDKIVSALNAQALLASVRIGSKDAHSITAPWIAKDKKDILTSIDGYDDLDLRWPAHGIPGTKGFELIDGLPKVEDYDYFVWKGMEPTFHPYGACYHRNDKKLSTGVIEYLRLKNITNILVGGLALDYCVKETALQLKEAGFKVTINLAATAGVSTETIQTAVDEMKKAGITFTVIQTFKVSIEQNESSENGFSLEP